MADNSLMSVLSVACGAMLIFGIVPAMGYDANDFATEVPQGTEGYVAGTIIGIDYITDAPMNDPNCALGGPTLNTTGDGWVMPLSAAVPVVPIYQPFRSFEIVTVGASGHLTLKFNHQVAHDKNNPYGIDLIVFGNATSLILSGGQWANGNAENTIVSGTVTENRGLVSVSKDGVNWYTFTNGPYACTFPPTASYQWDSVNHRWGAELDPTRPVDPNLTAAMVAGKTLAQMIDMYNGSAGGVGFDISKVGLDWIQYVKIERLSSSASNYTVIDAVADVSSCGDYKHPYPVGDINQDCRVNLADFALMCRHWLECSWNCN
jgi:hypothetical protein